MRIVGAGNTSLLIKARKHLGSAAILGMLLAAGGNIMAATLTWDAGGVSPANPADGSDAWDTSSLNWSNGATNVAWSSGSDAVFGNNNGAAGLVTIASGTTITSGNITFNAAGSGNYTITGGSIAVSTSAYTTITVNTNATIASAITGGYGFLYVNGSGVLTLRGQNTFTSSLIINSGAAVSVDSLTAGIGTELSNSTGGIRFNGGTLIYTGSSTTAVNRNYRVYAAGATFAMDGSGVFTLGSSFSSANGKTDNAGGANRTITLTGNGTGYGNFTGALANSTVAGDKTNLLKTGTGRWILAGNNTYTGTTKVDAGTLELGSSSTLANATGNVVVEGGKLTSTSSVASTTLGGNLSLTSGGISIAGDTATGLFQLAAGKNFSMTGGTFAVTIGSGSSFDVIAGSGALSITGGTIDLLNSVGLDYTQSYQIFSGFASGNISGLTIANYDTTDWIANLSDTGVLSFSTVQVPEPASVVMLTAGAGLLMMRRLRKR